MISLVRTFNLDGIDIDFEGGAFLRNPNDNNFQSPTTPRIVNAIRAIRDIRNAFPGWLFRRSDLSLEYISRLQGAYDSYDSAGFTTRGGYVPVIHALRDITTFVMTQDYNTGSVFGLDNNIYQNGASSSTDSQRSDFHVAMSDMLLQGFPVNRYSGKVLPCRKRGSSCDRVTGGTAGGWIRLHDAEYRCKMLSDIWFNASVIRAGCTLCESQLERIRTLEA